VAITIYSEPTLLLPNLRLYDYKLEAQID